MKRTVRRLGPVLGVAALASCTELDTARVQPFKATLGDDLYGALCDRLGASSLSEDTSGQSVQGICHPTADGVYQNDVDEAVLPPVAGEPQATARKRSIAKMRAMARWRSDLVRAFNATFPDEEIDDPTTEADGDKVRLHDGLMKFAQSLAPLYEADPFDAKREPLFPASTRALARVLDSIAKSDEAKAALSRLWGRRGYRPFKVGLGAVRSALGYPDLRGFTKASLNVLGPNGAGAPLLQQLFAAGKRELASAQPTLSQLAPYRLKDAATAQPERPRTTLEFTAELMLDQNDAYADAGAPSLFIALRDRRGFVVPLGNTPGVPGSVSSPFYDANSDGFADVDAFGRFIDGSNKPLGVALPFAIPGPDTTVTGDGMPGTPLYSYIDTSKTPIAAIAHSLRVLADPQNGALMDALAGARVLFGPREEVRYDYTKDPKDAIVKDGAECPTVPADACIKYSRFKGEESPLVDLIYATGPVLADAESDALLLGLLDLVENHEDDVARLLGAALKVRQIALDHDKLAQQGKEPVAAMPYQTPIWDEMAQVLARIVEEPRLVQKLVKGFSDPALVSPKGGSANLGATLSAFVTYRDEMNYHPENLNGPALNLTDNPAGGSTVDPQHPVDQTKPKTGTNRSLFERTLQLIHDVNGVHICNKQDAKVYTTYFGGSFVPFIDGDECHLVDFPNLAGLYFDAMLPDSHPKRAKMELKNNTLAGLLDFAQSVGINVDGLFEESSAITGMTLTPTVPALNRLVFFGAESDLYSMPDIDPYIDTTNYDTNQFISNLLNPAPTSSCPKKANGVNECSDASGTLRVKDTNTIFALERFGFYDYLQPVVIPFAEVGCSEDVSICPKNDPVAYYRGEQELVDLIDILHRHWSKDGGNTYEPILADAFKTDLLPALVEFSKVATEVSKITVARGPNAGKVWTGGDVLAKTAKILFSQDYAASINLTDRKGNKGTKWTDGTPQAQVTVYSLIADALHGMDVRFDTACDGAADQAACTADASQRKAQWKSARSRLVDEFLSVDGAGPGAQFRNKATPKLLARTLHLLREQINAHCPGRETGGGCQWARKDLADNLASTLSGPLFAALMDVQEALRADEDARKQTELLLVHLLSSADNAEDLQATLASFVDLLQVLQDDGDLAPILRAVAPASNPADDPDGQGAGDAMIRVLMALTDDKYDPYHVMDHVLPAAVKPMDNGADRAPLEIFIDAITDIHRIDADADASDQPLSSDDYKTIFTSVGQFMTSKTRGLEQFYYIVQNRPKP